MASKNKPVDLSERLKRQSRTVEAIRKDPAIPTEITVTLDELVPSEFNPRQSVNPKFDDIKASIKARGLDHRFNVTRKSVDDPYQIADGGNTRLQALQELWEETGDEKFFRHQVTFKPWVDDEESLAGHLVENDLRGDMKLIERALAAKRWIALIEDKEGKVSMRKAADRMKAKGWGIDSSNLSVLLYAVDSLHEHVPDLLWAGAGVPTVKKIRSYENAFKAYWDSLIENGEEPKEDLDSLWQNTLKEFDDVSFDFDGFFQLMSIKFSDAVDEPFSAVSSEIFSIMKGGKPSGVKSPQPNHPNAQLESSSSPAPAAPEASNSAPSQRPIQEPSSAPGASTQQVATPSKNEAPAVTAARATPGSTQDDTPAGSDQLSIAGREGNFQPKTLDDLLQESYLASCMVAEVHDIDHLLMPTYGEYDTAPGIGWHIAADLFGGFETMLSELRPIQKLWAYGLMIPFIGIAHDCAEKGQDDVVEAINAMLPFPFMRLFEIVGVQQAYIHTNMLRTLPDYEGASAQHKKSQQGLLAFDKALAAIRQHCADDYTSLFLESK
ncbi:ParB family protein [Gilvimarinus chinensis]|uniref:ParB family protein n=1 Tax=Gilvimarinus chinensis TaxID=396005 RepID=UPI00036B62B3|nr:ParB family protein [Gilvimarinus chinensis]